MMASPLKALCDKILTLKGVKINSKKAMLEMLNDDLRIDLDELMGLDISLVKEYANISSTECGSIR